MVIRADHTAPLATRIFALLALVALAATSLTPLVNTEWAGWRHDHGHITIGGAVAPHSHPWESNVSHEAATADGEQALIVFTATGDSVPGVTALWVAAPFLLAMAGTLTLAVGAAVVRLASIHIAPAPRPPKGSLSQHPIA